MEVTDRCPTCDRPLATVTDFDSTPENVQSWVARPDLCWTSLHRGLRDCRSHAVDWRERALKAEARLAGNQLSAEGIATYNRLLWLGKSDEARLELMALCCRHCGTTNLPCYCGPEWDE